MGSAMGWLLAWILMILFIFTISKTKIGEVIIYYVAWMLVLLVVVSHANQITTILKGGAFAPSS